MKTKQILSGIVGITMAMSGVCATPVFTQLTASMNAYAEDEIESGVLEGGAEWYYDNDTIYLTGNGTFAVQDIEHIRRKLGAHNYLIGKDVVMYHSDNPDDIDAEWEGISTLLFLGVSRNYAVSTYDGSNAVADYDAMVAFYAKYENVDEDTIMQEFPLNVILDGEEYVPTTFVSTSKDPSSISDPTDFTCSYDEESDTLTLDDGVIKWRQYYRVCQKYKPANVFLGSDLIIGDDESSKFLVIENIADTEKGINVSTLSGSDAARAYNEALAIEKTYGVEPSDMEWFVLNIITLSVGETDYKGNLMGDVNNDGSIGVTDAVKVMSFAANSEAYPLDELALRVGDVYATGDGINNMDALEIQKKLAQVSE
jgi:hypothetical protein